MLTPTKLPEKTESGIFLPESFTTKSTSGLCIKAGTDVDREVFIGKEVFFPKHDEYQIVDSDNGELYYVVDANHVIMMRTPAPTAKVFRVRETNTGTVEQPYVRQ